MVIVNHSRSLALLLLAQYSRVAVGHVKLYYEPAQLAIRNANGATSDGQVRVGSSPLPLLAAAVSSLGAAERSRVRAARAAARGGDGRCACVCRKRRRVSTLERAACLSSAAALSLPSLTAALALSLRRAAHCRAPACATTTTRD